MDRIGPFPARALRRIARLAAVLTVVGVTTATFTGTALAGTAVPGDGGWAGNPGGIDVSNHDHANGAIGWNARAGSR